MLPTKGVRSNMGDNYKYDVISTKIPEEVDTPLLGDNLKDAEELLAAFSVYINKMSGIYAASTNVDKGEFFGEAILALGKARSEFDPEKSGEFMPFAKFLILDSMNECVKANKAWVHVPSYVDKSHNIINRIRTSIFKYTEDLDTVLNDAKFRKTILPALVNDEVNLDITLLKRAAVRASITFEQLVERALVLPMLVTTDISSELIEEDTSQDALIAKLIVDKIKLLLDEDELAVADLIMQDRTKEEIGEILAHTPLWVNNRIKSIRRKVKRMVMWEG